MLSSGKRTIPLSRPANSRYDGRSYSASPRTTLTLAAHCGPNASVTPTRQVSDWMPDFPTGSASPVCLAVHPTRQSAGRASFAATFQRATPTESQTSFASRPSATIASAQSMHFFARPYFTASRPQLTVSCWGRRPSRIRSWDLLSRRWRHAYVRRLLVNVERLLQSLVRLRCTL